MVANAQTRYPKESYKANLPSIRSSGLLPVSSLFLVLHENIAFAFRRMIFQTRRNHALVCSH